MSRECGPYFWEHLEKVLLEELIEERVGGLREFEDHKISAWLEDPTHLSQSTFWAFEVAQAKRDCDCVEGVGRERKRERIGLDNADVRSASTVAEFVQVQAQHRVTEVRGDDAMGALSEHLKGQIAGAAAKIQPKGWPLS